MLQHVVPPKLLVHIGDIVVSQGLVESQIQTLALVLPNISALGRSLPLNCPSRVFAHW